MRLIDQLLKAYDYCTDGVKRDPRTLWWVKAVKILHLSVKKFMDKGLQDMAANLAFRTVLATVPALAMLFAIGKAFGFQKIVQSELLRYFPAQQHALEEASKYVDSYLAHVSQGVFVGIGLVFMLWTLISLMRNVEQKFNHIWGLLNDRPIGRQVIDYSAFLIIIPVIIICSAGLQIFMSETVQDTLPDSTLSPLLTRILDYTPIVLEWLAFTLAYKLIPNTKVQWMCAAVSGFLFGTVFYLFEWVLMAGQLWASSYNAIYGSFAFVLLFLLWLQYSWLIVLIGAVLTCSIQHNNQFEPEDRLDNLSEEYLKEMKRSSDELIATLREKHKQP